MIEITQEELVRYLYHETSEKKTAIIKAALQSDWNLREKFEMISHGQSSLDEINISPRPQAVNKILEYAAKKQQAQLHSL